MNILRKCSVIILAALLILISCTAFAKTGNDLSDKKCVISGTVSLPKGMKATKDVNITLLFSEDNQQYVDTSRIPSKDLTIRAGSNSVRYSLEVPSNSEGYISYRYESGENAFCYNAFHSANGTTFIFSKATKLKLQNKNIKDINLQLIKGRKLAGKVTIPTGATNVAYCGVIPIYDNGTPDNLKDDVTIFQAYDNYADLCSEDDSKTEAEYCMIVPDITAAYRIKYEMEYGMVNWGGSPILSKGFYSKSGITCDYHKADPVIVGSSYVGEINIDVIRSRKIQGKICLPDDKKADSDIDFYLFSDEGAREVLVKIPKGKNSGEYTLYFQDWKSKHIITVGYRPKYYIGQKEIVSDKSSAKEFDLSKGNIKNFDVILPDEYRTFI